ncbi:MAG TPA: hypothetical protein VFR59_14295, partial [Steroidobacteraceae bacterium]|nr:hypothetical protein [Steroidobacteraceae bacterium]
GGQVNVFAANDAQPTTAQVVAIDSRVDPSTRNAVVRAKVAHADLVVAPGASVRVVVPVGLTLKAVAIPASALRKGPGGDHVFVLEQDPKGQLRARERQVKVDALTGDEVIVQEGLAVGERVAASGSFKLRESVLVAVSNAAPTLASADKKGLVDGAF